MIRRARGLPIADELHRFLVEQYKTQRPASNVAPATGNTLNPRVKIHHCLSQGALEIDTNLVENMIRPSKLGMKNWMFFGSLEAGTNNSLIYTLLANCRAQDLDPEDYLVEVIKRLPHDATPEQCKGSRLTARAPRRPCGRTRGDEFRTFAIYWWLQHILRTSISNCYLPALRK